MGTRINTNIASLFAAFNLNTTQNSIAKSVERLSSGLRINRASDDAAGLVLSQSLRADLRSFEQAVRNATDGFNVLSIVDGAANEIQDIMIRMRQLAQQAANGILGSDTRAAVQSEFSFLQSEVTRIASTLTFNGVRLGIGGDINNAGVYMASNSVAPSGGALVAATSLNLQVGIRNNVADRLGIDTTLGQITSGGGGSRRLGLTAVGFRIMHVGEAGSTYTSVNTSALNHVGAYTTALSLNPAGVAVTTVSAARSALTAVDYAIRSMSLYRARIGASANRLERTINNTESTIRNVAASESFIRDTDFADETSKLVKNQVIAQAGAAALAQANLIPQAVLTLLG